MENRGANLDWSGKGRPLQSKNNPKKKRWAGKTPAHLFFFGSERYESNCFDDVRSDGRPRVCRANEVADPAFLPAVRDEGDGRGIESVGFERNRRMRLLRSRVAGGHWSQGEVHIHLLLGNVRDEGDCRGTESIGFERNRRKRVLRSRVAGGHWSRDEMHIHLLSGGVRDEGDGCGIESVGFDRNRRKHLLRSRVAGGYCSRGEVRIRLLLGSVRDEGDGFGQVSWILIALRHGKAI